MWCDISMLSMHITIICSLHAFESIIVAVVVIVRQQCRVSATAQVLLQASTRLGIDISCSHIR